MCQASNGTGTQTCNSTGTSYGTCGSLTSCNSGYTLQNGICVTAVKFKINLIYEASVTTNPNAVQIESAIARATQFLEAHITNPIVVNIQVGWGDVNGVPIPAIDAGEATPTVYGGFSLSYVVDALRALGFRDFLPATLPSGYTTLGVTGAQLKAFGYLDPNYAAVDGYVGFGSSIPWTFDNSGGVAANTADLEGVVIHEITHALGRVSGIGNSPPFVTVFDLFRYTAPGGIPALQATAYFSLDGGTTNLINFSSIDPGDWQNVGDSSDPFNVATKPGAVETMSALDFRALNALGFKTQ